MKKTLVIGASENPERYANKAIRMLRAHDHSVLAVGLRNGSVEDIAIQTGLPSFQNVDTVTLYVGPANQPVYYDYVLSLKPRRIIFNPGTENPEFQEKAEDAGIECLEACTLVLLSIDAY